MGVISIKYKGSTIAELRGKASKVLTTKGTYCEDDINIDYTPRSKNYEITLAKASGWVLLTTLDDDVVSHINDESLIVSLVNISPYAYEWYSGTMYLACNKPCGYNGNYAFYGSANRLNSETAVSLSAIYYPANSTDTNTGLGGNGAFRISGNKYYIKPGDGFISAGTYRLTFTW